MHRVNYNERERIIASSWDAKEEVLLAGFIEIILEMIFYKLPVDENAVENFWIELENAYEKFKDSNSEIRSWLFIDFVKQKKWEVRPKQEGKWKPKFMRPLS